MDRGFTLIELAIVLAIIAIVGAIILPNFLSTTDRAKLRSDVQSARVLQNASELYDAEHGTALARADAGRDIALLENGGYLPKNGAVIQTTGASWTYDGDRIIKVDISGSTDEIKKIAQSLDRQERVMIAGFGGDE